MKNHENREEKIQCRGPVRDMNTTLFFALHARRPDTISVLRRVRIYGKNVMMKLEEDTREIRASCSANPPTHPPLTPPTHPHFES